MSDLILGIETSCDETAAAIVEDGKKIISSVVASQISIHQKYGGVVPEIASRKHIEDIIPVIDKALGESGKKITDLSAIAVTYGPGLIGSLLVGLSVAKAMAYAQNLPLIGVNHLEAHIYANFLEHNEIKPPFVCLIVSGGHTSLVYIRHFGEYELLGQTKDDAAGEVFDKIAKVLDLGYPGGPITEKLAKEGEPSSIKFPRPLLNDKSYDFSFSGLKTAVIYYIRELKEENKDIPVGDILASFQQAVIDVLVEKTIKAALKFKTKQIILAGGVAANSSLRREIKKKANLLNIEVFYPSVSLCTDNAAMVASVGYYKFKENKKSSLNLDAVSRLPLVRKNY
ncbi:MAG: tRNA (adenosine(37)-N6)-threonylcarbamoyltransferase complex transferase subunit TsaD [Candidatus Caldatribacteriota bacterium]|nr:tRNA (adenosine(37)-N6)-threonylcarbamoyltransferase complex transferase subunit TsaD [Candidatus Caldatribacteriota bacterium]